MAKSDPPPPIVLAETFEATPSTSDPTFKFYQVAVPAFSFNQTGDQTGVTRAVPNVPGYNPWGSSFVRLGSFPDVSNPSLGPSGFATSLKLAGYIGAAPVPPSQDTLPFGYTQDPDYVLGFASDSRVQKKPLKPAQGFPETDVLLTKGGWWDHSDGNRISTTAGDKIEVIQGNYKMLILGRQPKPSLGVIRDLSGGMTQENNQTPSNCVKSIEYTQLYSGGEWSIYQYNGVGNVYSAFYGNVGDVYFGKLKESWTGLAPGGFTSEFYADSLVRDPLTAPIAGQEDPDIREYTWAKSIVSYTGSYNKPIPTIEEWTFADSIVTNNGSAAMPIGTTTETTWVGTTTSTTTVSGTVTETTTVAGAVTETSTLGSSTSTTTVSGAITEATTAASITGTTTATSITDTTTATSITGSTTAGAIATYEFTGPASATDIFLGPLKTGVAVAAIHTDVKVGSVVLNASLVSCQIDLFVGVMKFAADVCALNLHYGTRQVNIARENNWSAIKTAVNGLVLLGEDD